MTACHILIGGVTIPTKTFYNLSDEKKERLISAIKEEIARVPFSDISINRIIRSAGIPRGSFYQYFSGKNDMLDLLLVDIIDTILLEGTKKLDENGGDIFQMFRGLFDFIYAYITRDKAFCQNLFSDIRIFHELLSHCPVNVKERILTMFTSKINQDILNIQKEEDYSVIIDVLLTITGQSIAETFHGRHTFPEMRHRYRRRLDLLEDGLRKPKEVNLC